MANSDYISREAAAKADIPDKNNMEVKKNGHKTFDCRQG